MLRSGEWHIRVQAYSMHAVVLAAQRVPRLTSTNDRYPQVRIADAAAVDTGYSL